MEGGGVRGDRGRGQRIRDRSAEAKWRFVPTLSCEHIRKRSQPASPERAIRKAARTRARAHHEVVERGLVDICCGRCRRACFREAV
eukprot:6199602-Pleurochrysis_carterae.AAC.1